MKELSLTTMAIELLTINEDFNYYCVDVMKTKVSDFELFTFTQVWGNTSGGFEGMGGSAMTEQRTYVFIPKYTNKENCLVFFGGAFAYSVPYSQAFIEDVLNKRVASKPKSKKYLCDKLNIKI